MSPNYDQTCHSVQTCVVRKPKIILTGNTMDITELNIGTLVRTMKTLDLVAMGIYRAIIKLYS